MSGDCQVYLYWPWYQFRLCEQIEEDQDNMFLFLIQDLILCPDACYIQTCYCIWSSIHHSTWRSQVRCPRTTQDQVLYYLVLGLLPVPGPRTRRRVRRNYKLYNWWAPRTSSSSFSIIIFYIYYTIPLKRTRARAIFQGLCLTLVGQSGREIWGTDNNRFWRTPSRI